MLHTQAVSPKLLGVLKNIMSLDEFSEFRLVGGTALALQEGHRDSVDIDLFGTNNLDESIIGIALQKVGKTNNLSKSKTILTYTVEGVKVDIVKYPYPWIGPLICEDNIRMASKQDIAAMKINAISGRGSKKDFIDLHLLLKHYSLSEILGFFKQKFNEASIFLALKSLHYFDDADEQISPLMHSEHTWTQTKEEIKTALNEYMKNQEFK